MDFLPTHYVYGMCRCYVWPLGMWWGSEPRVGHCGRCGEQPRIFNQVIGPEEALAIYFDNYGNYPEPMGEDYWFEKYLTYGL